jgi:formylglycine-generating enzyme required for sulfatase activity
MRKSLLLIVMLMSIALHSCVYEDFDPADWAVTPELDLSESGLIFNATNNQDTIKITTNYQNFTVWCSDEWCKIIPDVEKYEFTVQVEPNMNAEQRRSTIYVNVGRGGKTLTKTLSVVQMGGYWDVVGQFSIFWSSDVTETQKETISDILSDMVYVKGGKFVMGSDEYGYVSINGDVNEWEIKEECSHNVTLSDFYINRKEVTQKQWNVIMSSNDSHFKGENLPIENIEWEEALDFVNKLARLTNVNFTLPTEAQWEYAARGGIYSMGYINPGSNDYSDVMIYKGDRVEDDPLFTTDEVGQLWPNELGLYNMAGNVSEICFDWYGDYDLSDQVDPVGPATGKYHVIRGGDITTLSMSFVYLREPFISKTSSYVGIRLCVIL